ncbi:hypothetical protein D3C78_421970 [compost metagenome]
MGNETWKVPENKPRATSQTSMAEAKWLQLQLAVLIATVTKVPRWRIQCLFIREANGVLTSK